MAIKFIIGEMIFNIVSVYVPQVGCEEEEKDKFWQDLDSSWSDIPNNERVAVAGDWNGHVGSNSLAFEKIRGGCGAGSTSNEGERLIDLAMASDVALLSTFYCKRDYTTYASGGQETQLDYILCRRGLMNEVKNCKVIKGESVAKQHYLVVGEINIKKTR